ncbi:doublecortin domain-containing protein 2-like, partial [Salvelinus namaycush]|uniref:Doublecortin domain-containing protein 2 n=1 Tax=Salvelinus namaycush TaxID=8040 RepID=A0A8U0QD89_SALNM
IVMNSEKPNFLSQPVVKNIFVYRNGDPFYEARRLVVNQKRVSNFDTFLRDVTGGVQAPFGAVRNIYTPRMGHRVACLDHLQSGEQYVAAGREKFKKLDYSQIGSKKKRMLLTTSGQNAMNKDVENKGVENKGVETKGVGNKGVENKGVENKGVENQGVENKGVENKGVGNKDVENQGVENKGVENKGVENKGVENKGVENQGVENQGVENKDMENKGVENKDVENKGVENKDMENKGVENKGVENQGVGNKDVGNKDVGNKDVEAKPVPQSRIIVSARFLKPIKEPCSIFVVANGDVLNPALRLLIPQRILGQYDRVLEMITDKMGLRILGCVRSLYTFDGNHVNDGKDLESGQFYVAVGRDKFKRLPYSDLLFTKPRGIRRTTGSKASSLPPIYTSGKQNRNS